MSNTSQTVPISKLSGWDKNPRGIKKDDYNRLKKQIQDLGVYKPLLVNEEYIVLGGNMRLKVLQDLGVENVWVSIVKASTPEMMAKYALSDNDEAGYYDEQQLAELLQPLEINLDEYRVNLGKPISINELLAKFGPDVIEDEPPALEEEAVSKRGEIYQLGRHRLMCGDATSKEDVERLMDGKKADMVVTSPPYWLGFEYEQEKNEEDILVHIEKVSEILSDTTNGRIIINTANIASITKNEKIFGKKQVGLIIDLWRDALNSNGYLLRNIRIWAKDGGMRPSAEGDSVDMHWEYIAEFLDAGFSANFYKENAVWKGQNRIGNWANQWSMSGLWINIKGNARSNGHVAAFPVEIPWRLLQLYSNKGDIVLEPYGGSGTTLIACEETNRTCFMMELDPKYCDVIRKRYANFINKGDIWQEITPLINNQ